MRKFNQLLINLGSYRFPTPNRVRNREESEALAGDIVDPQESVESVYKLYLSLF